MVRYRLHTYFVLLMFFYFSVRIIRVGVNDISDFIRFYLTDLIFVPTMALFSLIFVRFLKRNQTIRISPSLVFFQVVLVSLFFEWYLPNYSAKSDWYTSDPWDVFNYILGGFIFLLIQRTV